MSLTMLRSYDTAGETAARRQSTSTKQRGGSDNEADLVADLLLEGEI